MSTAIFNAKASGMALKNDALRGAFAIDGTRCFLLKRGEHTSVFTSVVELTAGYRLKDGVFTYADIDLDFRDEWAQGTHLAYGVPASSQIEVFELEEKVEVDPDGSDVYWRANAIRTDNERYTIPTP